MNKKEIAINFLKLASSGKASEAFEKYVHSDFRHHNAYFKSDRQSLLLGMEESGVKFPNKIFTELRVIEDDVFVVVHGKVQLFPGAEEIALIHIFQFKDDLIIDEWEVAQVLPKETINDRGIF